MWCVLCHSTAGSGIVVRQALRGTGVRHTQHKNVGHHDRSRITTRGRGAIFCWIRSRRTCRRRLYWSDKLTEGSVRRDTPDISGSSEESGVPSDQPGRRTQWRVRRVQYEHVGPAFWGQHRPSDAPGLGDGLLGGLSRVSTSWMAKIGRCPFCPTARLSDSAGRVGQARCVPSEGAPAVSLEPNAQCPSIGWL